MVCIYVCSSRSSLYGQGGGSQIKKDPRPLSDKSKGLLCACLLYVEGTSMLVSNSCSISEPFHQENISSKSCVVCSNPVTCIH